MDIVSVICCNRFVERKTYVTAAIYRNKTAYTRTYQKVPLDVLRLGKNTYYGVSDYLVPCPYAIFFNKEMIVNNNMENPGTVYIPVKTDEESMFPMESGRLLFRLGNITNAAVYRDCEVDIGILPYPKYDVNQEDYISQDWGGLMCIPVSITDAPQYDSDTLHPCIPPFAPVRPLCRK